MHFINLSKSVNDLSLTVYVAVDGKVKYLLILDEIYDILKIIMEVRYEKNLLL